jgi:hypothetical protein
VHDLTVAVSALLAACLVILDLIGRRRGSRAPSARRLLSAAPHDRPALVLVVLTRWWFSWHFSVSGG